MKKNLLALFVLIVLVAVVSQFTRQGGKKAEWVAFEHDLQTSLELLWQQPGQSVELREMEGGAQALVAVQMPADSSGDWNYALVRFVAERHPAVKLTDVKVREAASLRQVLPGVANAEEGATAQRHSELMRRQAQATLRDRGLLLVDVRETTSAPNAPLEMKIERGAEAAPGRSRRANSGKAYLQASPPATPQIQVHGCLVVLPDVSPAEIDQAVKGLNLVPERGDQLRVVKLPLLAQEPQPESVARLPKP